MKKIILNKCFGGYEWSRAAALDYVERSGINPITFVKWVKGGKPIAATKKQYLANEYGVEMYIGNLRFYEGSIDRTDPIAIQLLEEKGSEYCSGPCGQLEIEEYDNELFDYNVDNYDGVEELELIPMLTEDRIRKCGSVDRIVELLYSCNVLRKDGAEK